jgi:hypothetical protein
MDRKKEDKDRKNVRSEKRDKGRKKDTKTGKRI